MATYGAMQTRIADELARADLTANIALSILSAIDWYERKRFYFNESRDLTFNTVDGQEFYDSTDLADIPNIVEIDELTLTISTKKRDILKATDFSVMEKLSSNPLATGTPRQFCYYGEQIRLYPIPDSVKAVVITGIKRFTTLSAAADTNAWMTDAEELIRTRAKWDLFTHVVRDFTEAGYMKVAEQDSYDNLLYETSQRVAPQRIQPTEW